MSGNSPVHKTLLTIGICSITRVVACVTCCKKGSENIPLMVSASADNNISKHHVWHTRAESFEGGAVVFVHPLVTVLEQQADRRRSPVKLVNLESLDHLPVPP